MSAALTRSVYIGTTASDSDACNCVCDLRRHVCQSLSSILSVSSERAPLRPRWFNLVSFLGYVVEIGDHVNDLEEVSTDNRPRIAQRCEDIQHSGSVRGSSSSSGSESPPRRRRRHGFRKMVRKMVQPRSSISPDQTEMDSMHKEYVGVRYRVELNKYVTEIRPTKSTKKIWLGTYDTAEEAARAFDIGNLCCKKNLPLNFPDSPRMLRKISSRLSPDEARNAIAKLAKEVARVVVINVSSPETTKRKEVDRAAAQKAHQLVQQTPHEPDEPELEYSDRRKSVPRTQHVEAETSSAITYTETFPETQFVVEEMEFAKSMPLNAGLEGGSGGSFDMIRLFCDDERADLPLHMLINFGTDQSRGQMNGDVFYHYVP